MYVDVSGVLSNFVEDIFLFFKDLHLPWGVLVESTGYRLWGRFFFFYECHQLNALSKTPINNLQPSIETQCSNERDEPSARRSPPLSCSHVSASSPIRGHTLLISGTPTTQGWMFEWDWLEVIHRIRLFNRKWSPAAETLHEWEKERKKTISSFHARLEMLAKCIKILGRLICLMSKAYKRKGSIKPQTGFRRKLYLIWTGG